MTLEGRGGSFTPSRLRLARQRRGYTMKALADELGITPPMVTYYEAGEAEPPDDLIVRAAGILKFPPGFFRAGDIEAMRPEAVSFRARRSLTANLRDRVLSANEVASQIISPAFRTRYKLPEIDVPDLAGKSPEDAARTLRDAWGLGEAPVHNMVHLLEAHGVEVYWLNEPSPCVDAVSYWVNGFPFVTLNLGKSGERGRMDAAHELGHLVLHRHCHLEGKELEDEANRFASAFLMPPHQFRLECPQLLSFTDLFVIKKRWQVSIAAMIVRAHELGIYSDWTYGRGFRDLSARGWRKKEPEPIARETSSLQAQLYERMAQRGMTLARWTAELRIARAEISELTPEVSRLEVVIPPPRLWSDRPKLTIVQGGTPEV